MRLLITGGTGNISWRLAQAARAAGCDVTLLNRGVNARRTPPTQVDTIVADLRDLAATDAALGPQRFDAVVDFICYNGQQAGDAVALFGKRTARYVFISTTGIYDRAVAPQPLREDAPTLQGGWRYAMGKREAEDVFAHAFGHEGFPITIVRPGHTYDVLVPDAVGFADWTNLWRMLNGKPVIVHGDGTTPWTLTHSSDVANGIVQLLAARNEPGQAYHVTGDATLTWDQITGALAQAVGAPRPSILHRAVDDIARVSEKLGEGIRGHKMWPEVYDTSKFRTLCPGWRASVSLSDGLGQTVDHYRRNPELMQPNPVLDAALDELCRPSTTNAAPRFAAGPSARAYA